MYLLAMNFGVNNVAIQLTAILTNLWWLLWLALCRFSRLPRTRDRIYQIPQKSPPSMHMKC
jgi:hypothetical protein